MDRRLPDTPWHIGYAKKEEYDPRRHKARCIHNVDGVCTSSRSNYCRENCGGSSHCEEYSETYEDYNKKLEERKTIDEIERDNIAKYKVGLIRKKKELVKSNNILRHKSTEELRRCLICDEGLKKIKFSLKKCMYCGMYYVNLKDSTELQVLDEVNTNEVFLMNIPRKKEAEYTPIIQVNHGVCKYMNDKIRCTFKNSKRYTRRCKESGCKYFAEK